MVLLFPVKNDTNSVITSINWKLCEYLKKYIEERGDNATIARASEKAPEINPLILKYSSSADTYLQVDINPELTTKYSIQATTYSALVGAINYELACIYDLQDKESLVTITKEDPIIGSNNDIYINFSNDLISKTDIELENLAMRIIESAFWYPIKTIKNLDDPGNIDPYFYRFISVDSWKEENYTDSNTPEYIPGFKLGQDYSQCSGTIQEEGSTTKIKFLKLKSNFSTSTYTSEKIGTKESEETPGTFIDVYDTPPIQHYTWRIPCINSNPDKLVLTVRGTGTVYIKVGPSFDKSPDEACFYQRHLIGSTAEGLVNNTGFIIKTQDINTASFTTLDPFDISGINKYESIEIGIQGNGEIDFTGIWAYKSTTTKTYNYLPEGYRDIEIEKQEEIPENNIKALTLMTTLKDRDTDKIIITEEQEQDDPESPTDGLSIDSPAGFGNIMDKVMNTLSNAGTAATGIMSLGSMLKIDTSSMKSKIKDMSSYKDKIDLSKVKDKLDSISKGANQQATAIANKEKDKLAAKAKALSNNNLNAVKEKQSALKEKAKLPSIESQKGISDIKEKEALVNSKIKDTTDKLKSGLTKQAAKLKESAASKMQTKVEEKNKAKNAVDNLKSIDTKF